MDPTHPNVVAGSEEGKWAPAAGYHWANANPKDLTVARNIDAEAFMRATIKIVGSQAVLAEARKENDGSFGDAISLQALVAARDALVYSAMQDLFPDASDRDLSTGRRLLCLAMDGQFDTSNWNSATAHDQLMLRLREDNPDMANAAEVADFIGKVIESYKHQ